MKCGKIYVLVLLLTKNKQLKIRGSIMKTIAIVDDDEYISDMLKALLEREGFHVIRAFSGTEALMILDKEVPDLVLLDLMLPGLSGEEVLPKIKEIPTIILSAKVEVSDKVKLLLEGAADYITKPFDTNELLARIIVQLRKHEKSREDLIRVGELELNLESHELAVNGAEVRLTKTEYAILKLLMRNPTQVISKSSLLDQISVDTPDCVESSLKVHISNLRKKLRSVSEKDYIVSVWGIGFRLNAA